MSDIFIKSVCETAAGFDPGDTHAFRSPNLSTNVPDQKKI